MAETRFSGKDSKMKKFLSGKGFYIALAVCLVGAGAASWVAIDSSLKGLDEGQSIAVPQESSEVNEDWGFPELEETNEEQSDVEISSRSSTQESTSSSSSTQQQPSSGQSEPSEQQVLSPTQQEVQFMLPLSGDVITKYSAGELVKNQTLGDWRTHDGIDMAAAAGTPVKAVAEGTVESVIDDPLWGKTVSISHAGGYESYYAGLAEDVSLKEGQAVEIGQLVGYVGESPLTEVALESHLHFGLKQDGEWVDPLVSMDKLQD